MYENKLRDLGVDSVNIRGTTLKDRLLAALPDLCAVEEKKRTYLAFSTSVSGAIKSAMSADRDGVALAHAARHVRSIIISKELDNQDSVLHKLLHSIMFGSEVNDSNDEINDGGTHVRQAVKSIAQTIKFNTLQYSPKNNSDTTRHNQNKETELQKYIALKIHVETGSNKLIDIFHRLGICISYRRVMDFTKETAHALCKYFESEGVVCPSDLRKHLFTIAALDNIDHNPSSNTALDSYHGTAISLHQFRLHENEGVARSLPPIVSMPNMPI